MRYIAALILIFQANLGVASVEIYSEAGNSTSQSNFVASGHLRYKKSDSSIKPLLSAYISMDAESERDLIFNDNFYALGAGFMAKPLAWATLIAEYRYVESQFKEQNRLDPNDGRVLAIAGKDWMTLRRGPGRGVLQLYGESVLSTRLKSNVFNTGFIRLGYDFGSLYTIKPYIELRSRRDTLYWISENTNEARIGVNLGSSIDTFRWNMFLYQTDRMDLKTKSSIQEFAGLLTVGGEVF